MEFGEPPILSFLSFWMLTVTPVRLAYHTRRRRILKHMEKWSNRNLTAPTQREQAALTFIQSVEDSEPSFDFEPIASELVALPEMHTYGVELPETSAAAIHFIDRLQGLAEKTPMIGLKVLTIVCCNEQCSYYPKSLLNRLYALWVECLEVRNMPRWAALEWGVHCWRDWPNRYFSRGADELVPALIRLLIAEAEVNPEHAFSTVMSLESRRSTYSYVFSPSKEDAWETTRLGRALLHIEPKIYTESLQRFLWDGRHGYNDYLPGEDKLRDGAKQLHEVLLNKFNANPHGCEGMVRSLILFAFPDEPWYFELHEMLWSIELQKEQWSQTSLHNLAMIAMNCGSHESLRTLAEERFRLWANDFTSIDRDPRHSYIKAAKADVSGRVRGTFFSCQSEPLELHAKSLIDTVNGALHDQYPQTRNQSFVVPEHCRLADIAVNAFWELTNWLEQVDKRHYFQTLLVGVENSSFPTAVTEELGHRAKQKLLEGFEEFARTNLEECSELLALMVSRSGYTSIGPRISTVLDMVYPILKTIDESAAESGLQIGLRFQRSHMRLWEPRSSQLRS